MIWGAIWVSERSDLYIMNRDKISKKQGYSARSYIEVLEDQLPIIWLLDLVFIQNNALIHTTHFQAIHTRYMCELLENECNE